MLEKMDSKLQLSSIKNIGSTFSFKLVANYQSAKVDDHKSAREFLSDKIISEEQSVASSLMPKKAQNIA